MELLLSLVSRKHSQSANHRVPLPFTAPHSRQAADRLGWATGTPQPHHLGVHPPAARAIVGRVSPGVRARTQSRGVFVVSLEAARITQPMPTELRATEPLRPPSAAADAPALHFGDRLLATGGTFSIVTILCKTQ